MKHRFINAILQCKRNDSSGGFGISSENRRSSPGKMIVTFAILLIFWYILSGYFDLFHIGAGIICCGIVTFISGDLILRSDRSLIQSGRVFIRFILFLPRLMVEILYANLDVAYRILHPKMPIDPEILIVDTGFSNDVLRTAFANAITLTPGTVTVAVEGGRFTVHALVRSVSEEDLLQNRSIQKRLADIFGEGQ
jgi:multicomponent Na+:H+ antiporter subunit E